MTKLCTLANKANQLCREYMRQRHLTATNNSEEEFRERDQRITKAFAVLEDELIGWETTVTERS